MGVALGLAVVAGPNSRSDLTERRAESSVLAFTSGVQQSHEVFVAEQQAAGLHMFGGCSIPVRR
jgi:hypothetical protein